MDDSPTATQVLAPAQPAEGRPPPVDAPLPAGPLKHLFVGVLLAIMLIDGTPRTCAWHRWIVQTWRPALSLVSLHQPKWQLFAPGPMSSNQYVTARVTLSDGQVLDWRSPDWRRLSLWQRFLHCRHIKFYGMLQGNARRDKTSASWPSFADYLARLLAPPDGRKVTRVELTSHWYDITRPTDRWQAFGTSGEYKDAKLFFAKDYP